MSLPSSRRLLFGSLRVFGRNWRSLVLVAATVAVPVFLLGLLPEVVNDPVIASYLSLSFVILNLAVLSVAVAADEGERLTVREAYFKGTANLVKFLIVLLLLVLRFLPLIVGGYLFIAGSQGISGPVSSGERTLLALVWLILAIPSFLMVSRNIFAIFAIDRARGPIAAMRTSRRLVRGQSWAVGRRLILLIVLMILFVAVPVAGSVLITAASPNHLYLALLQLIVTLTLLPITYIYLHRLYRALP